ncbi:MAG: C39 family peptidase [Patescibacteria group bacterium]
MKKKIFIVLILVALSGIFYFGRHQIANLWEDWNAEPLPEPTPLENINAAVNQNQNINSAANENINSTPVVLPSEFNLVVPFTTQSPFAEWTEQDNESCEEAAILTVHYYWQKKTFTKQIAKDELQKIVDYEMAHLGFYKDTDAEETAKLAKDMWGYSRVDVIWDPTLDDIKQQVYAGRPVILPTAGRELHNPNFKTPGPIYHMLVVRGWTKDTIITNDPGTRKGENYQYSPDILMNAVHDWNDGDIMNGEKAMIVIYPNV